jgi:hypothetical protein
MDSKQFLQTMSLSDKLKNLYVIFLTKNGVQEGYNKMVTILNNVIESDVESKQAGEDDAPPPKRRATEPSRSSTYRREIESRGEGDDVVPPPSSPNSSEED